MPSREVGMLRNTRVNMSIPGNVFDRQHARRDPEEFLFLFKKFGNAIWNR